MLIPIADARVDEDAMVVCLGNTSLTDTAMLGPSGFQDLTRSTVLSWVKEGMVVRVQREVIGEVVGADVSWIGGAGEIEE